MATGARILLCNVDELAARAILRVAHTLGHEVLQVAEVTALAAASGSEEEPDPDLLVVGVDGGRGSDEAGVLERVRSARKQLRTTPVVVLAQRIKTDTVVRLLRMQVHDVIGMPAPPSDLAARVLEPLQVRVDAAREMLGQSARVQRLRDELAASAVSCSPVLLTGPTGSGKSLAARVLHELSHAPADGRRARGAAAARFEAVDCAALRDDEALRLRESIAGAEEPGTIFLDEVADLSLPHQALLLHALEDADHDPRRVLKPRRRVVAATQYELTALVSEQRFRADLYFRLSVFRIAVPPLCERMEDLPLLARGLTAVLADRLGVAPPALEESFVEALGGYEWPGNIRELESVLERVLVRGAGPSVTHADLEGVLDGAPRRLSVEVDLAGETGGDDGQKVLRSSLTPELPAPPSDEALRLSPAERQERALVAAALSSTGGNVARAARRLDIPRSTLRYRIRRYALSDLIPKD